MDKRVIITGGGASGLAAAIAAAKSGAGVLLLEKNEKLGKKIYITGKGRCNLTNACEPEEFFRHVVRSPRFMYSSFRKFGNTDIMELLEEGGLRLKTERGGRVFPVSDHASDVTKTLEKTALSLGVRVQLGARVDGLVIRGGACRGVRLGGRELEADSVIVSTGGLSYPSTGSTGDGYEWARLAGHDIRPLSPSLVPVSAKLPAGEDISQLAGLSPRNVTLTLIDGKKRIKSDIGELLFTHTGISGPLVLTMSAMISGRDNIAGLKAVIDWKPALSAEELDRRLLRYFDEAKNKSLRNVMRGLLPESAVAPLLAQAGAEPSAQVNGVSKAQRQAIVRSLKAFELELTGLGGYESAVVTRGGVNTAQVDPATMESKLVKDLYFTGEVLDVDAFTGGFNLQIAWSTGWAAGCAAAGE